MRARVIPSPSPTLVARGLFAAWFAVIVSVLTAGPTRAGWPGSPNVNLPVCTAPGSQAFRTAVSDGSSGLLVAWMDTRGDSADIYVQRVGAAGEVLWEWNGVRACGAPRDQDQPVVAGDGAGGAFVAWRDFRAGQTGDVYAQRFDAGGAPLWTANGVGVCTVTGEQANPSIVPDGAGGVVVVWEDSRAVLAIYAQRLNAAGTRLWNAGGVRLAPLATIPQFEPSVASDGTGGAIVTWTQTAAGSLDVVAQRVSDIGELRWGTSGLALCGATGDQFHARVAADGLLGAVFAWEDHRSGVGQIHVQQVDRWGNRGWGADGLVAGPSAGNQFVPALISDGAGAAVVAWHDQRAATSDIWAQRVHANGQRAWGPTGFPVCLAGGEQTFASVSADGSGGALIAWEDARAGNDIYAQRVSGSGQGRWPQDGVPVSNAAGSQYQAVVTSQSDSVGVVVWVDQRSGGSDLYAQRVPAVVTLGAAPPGTTDAGLVLHPHPLRATGAVRFTLPEARPVRLEVFDASGRRVRLLAEGPLVAGSHEHHWDGRDHAGRTVPAGLYLVRLVAGDAVSTARWVRLAN